MITVHWVIWFSHISYEYRLINLGKVWVLLDDAFLYLEEISC